MPAEIIAIGSELTSGARLDTNSQWLSVELDAAGITVDWHTTIADDLAAMLEAFRIAAERADLVLITGGLGPTLDDLTRQALAEVTGTRLVLHEPSLAAIRDMFARRQRKMAERNVVQAMFPEGCDPLPNPVGTAPGIWIEVPRRDGSRRVAFAALPGVPIEMKRMFVHEVLPRVAGSGRVIRRAKVHSFGAGESDVEEMLGDLTARDRDPEIGITAHEATITLRIFAAGNTVGECDDKILHAKQAIRERLGSLVFGEEADELEHVVVRMLVERGMTLATAECGTGGLLAQRLTDSPDVERCYAGGVVVPTAVSVCGLLDADPAAISEITLGSAETARAMAEGCRRRFGTDFALAVAAFPRPSEESATVFASGENVAPGDAPFVHVALAAENGILESHGHALLHDATLNRSRASKMALDLLRRHLDRSSDSPNIPG